jgi:hypothetical protein
MTLPATNQPYAATKILLENVFEVTLLLDPSLSTQVRSKSEQHPFRNSIPKPKNQHMYFVTTS